jgi:hypothetical protein
MKLPVKMKLLAIGAAIITLCSCDKKVMTESLVASDGSIERTIMYEQDTSVISENIFGIGSASGWTASIAAIDIPENDNVKRSNNTKYRVTMKKHYRSVDEANAELASPSPKTFRMESKFDKSFRWFYTYTTYSDTYKALNKFENVPRDSFFTREDIGFVERLPAEGSQISKADSIYLDQLTEKVGTYFTIALFDKHFELVVNAARERQLSRNWIDSLYQYKGLMYTKVMKDEVEPENEQTFMIPLIQSLNIGFPLEILQASYTKAAAALQPSINFMTTVGGEMHFQHRIQMPGEIVTSNADSLALNAVVWNPMTVKFMLTDYTMNVESRTMNVWAVATTAAIVALTAWLWSRRKRPYPG